MKAMARGITTGLVVLALAGCDRFIPRPTAKKKAAAQREPLSESYTSKNGLVTAHYPASFAAKTVGKSVVMLARNLDGGLDEAITFVPIEKPISDELGEFARIVAKAEEGALDGFTLTSSGPATCNGQSGTQKTGTWGSSATYIRRACYFLRNGHGYSVAYIVPQSRAAEETPVLVQIVEAMEFNR